MGFSTILYNIAIAAYAAGVRLAASLGKEKARLWLDGRKNWRQKLADAVENDQPYIWMHAASLGEFEQGRPLLEAFRKDYPRYKLILTFFSPSGYENKKNYQGADTICYLPLDTGKNAKDFLAIVRPELAIFVKYEFWYHYLTQLSYQNVPIVLVSGLFREKQVFFKPYGGMFRRLLQGFDRIFVQNEDSLRLLTGIQLNNVTLAGDTRFDRVWAARLQARDLPVIKRFVGEQKALIAGSTWPKDEEIIAAWWQNAKQEGRVIILAPHEIDGEHIAQIQQKFPGATRYSEYAKNPVTTSKVLIIDNIGMLSALYRYAYVTYVGGGFGTSGLHNILEAATYSKPVLFGPNIEKFPEAIELVQLRGAFIVRDVFSFTTTVAGLSEMPKYRETATVAGKFVEERQGATWKILDYIHGKRFLTTL